MPCNLFRIISLVLPRNFNDIFYGGPQRTCHIFFYRAIKSKYRAINGKHSRSRNRLSRTLFPWTTMVATVEEVCFEVNRNTMATAKRKKFVGCCVYCN